VLLVVGLLWLRVGPRSGVISYSSQECTALLQCIQAVLPIGNEQWQMVAELHGNQYSHCNRTTESIRCKFSALANVQPGSGNPTIPPLILRAKQIREAINIKAGVTDADVSDFFDDAQDVVVADDNLLEDDELEVTDAVDVVAARRGTGTAYGCAGNCYSYYCHRCN